MSPTADSLTSNGQEPRSIFTLIEAQVALHGNIPALSAPSREPLSYAALLDALERVKASLNEAGLGRGDRVALVLPNGPEIAVAFLAVAASATAAPLNPSYRRDEFEFYLKDSKAKALIVMGGSDLPAAAVARGLGLPILSLSVPSGAPAGGFDLSCDAPTARRADGFAQPDDVALVLHTSGTTSRPKLVPLTQANLCASARNIRAALALTPGDRCLNVMPLFHIHGLIGALLSSIAAGASVICTPGFYAPEFFGWIDAHAPTWYSAVPTMHQSIVQRAAAHQAIIARRPLRFIRSSSAALAPKVIADLEAAFGAPVVEAYGMTEASHQMAINPLPPGVRKPGSVGLATGIRIGIMDDAGNLLARGALGEVVIHGETVTHGYEDNPDANAKAFTDGWFRTGDQGYLDEDGYLFLTGRLKEIINRGGEKISPREVDEALLAHPDVAQALAFAMPDPALGEEVAAVIVRREGAAVTERALRDFVAARLAEFKVPRRIVFLEEIPRGPTGKLQRIGLAERLGLTAEPQPAPVEVSFVEPSTPVEEFLASIWREVLGVEQVGVAAPFLHLGGDSLLATRIVARIRDAVQIEVTLRDFFDTPTIAEMAAIIEQKLLDELPE